MALTTLHIEIMVYTILGGNIRIDFVIIIKIKPPSYNYAQEGATWCFMRLEGHSA